MFAEKVFSDTCGDFSISPWDIKWAQMEGKGGSELCKKQKEENRGFCSPGTEFM